MQEERNASKVVSKFVIFPQKMVKIAAHYILESLSKILFCLVEKLAGVGAVAVAVGVSVI